MIECREIVNNVKRSDPDTGNGIKGETTSCKECQELQNEFTKNPNGIPMKSKGLVLLGVTGGSAIALSLICLPFLTPALRKVCLPYVPATSAQIENVMSAVSKNRSTLQPYKLIDIGSGDGRIVIEAASRGFKAHGVELNLWLVLYSKFRAFKMGLRGSATFARQDLWKTDFSPYQRIVVFGVEEMMQQLETKLASDLNANSEVVACRFPFPNWKAEEIYGEGIDAVWLYKPPFEKKLLQK